MKRMRFIALLLVIFVLFTACGGGGGTNTGTSSNTSSADNTSSVVSQTPVEIQKGEYYIVVPVGSSYKDTFAVSVYNVMKDWDGMDVKCVDDSATYDAPEIIIGECNRPVVAEARATLLDLGGGGANDYIIYANGNKIVILGQSDDAVKTAVDKFVANHLKQGATLTGVVDKYIAPKEGNTSITVNGTKLDSKFYIVTPQYNMSYIVRLQIEELNKALSQKAGVALTETTDATAPTFTQQMYNLFYGRTWANCETATDYKQYLDAYNALDKTVTPTSYEYEIVIGDCNRAGCPKISNSDQYTIKVSGNKIFLNGGSNKATAMAVSEFAKMVRSGSLTLTDASTITGSYKSAVSGYNRENYYTLTWSDDFNGNAIDESKWFVSYGRDSTIYANGLNNRIPARASKDLNNNYVKDGKLYICAAYDNSYYYGGHLSTKDTMRMTYGYVEISCLKPQGQGFWTALWVDNHQLDKGLARMEIDVNESYGPAHLTLQNSITWVNARGIRNCITKYGFKMPTGFSFHKANINMNKDTRGFHLDFHTFGYGWDENTLIFTTDGKVTFKYDYATNAMVYGNATSVGSLGGTIEGVRQGEIEVTKSAFETPAYLRLSMAVGFDSREFVVPDGNKEWTESNKFIVDYVHVYQLKGQKMTLY